MRDLIVTGTVIIKGLTEIPMLPAHLTLEGLGDEKIDENFLRTIEQRAVKKSTNWESFHIHHYEVTKDAA